MATTSPATIVEHNMLRQPRGSGDAIQVGSPDWYAWLANATSFTFRGASGTFTAHKEQRSPTQEYWRAYRRRSGRLQRAYLGKSDELTLERLHAVAAQLAGDSRGLGQPRQHPIGRSSASADNTQSLHLMTTKLALPPLPVRHVPRPHLVRQLNTAIGSGQKLVLISAPAGFGKTTLLLEWLSPADGGKKPRASAQHPLELDATASHPFRVAWLALDETDNHLGTFLAYLIAMLEMVRPDAGADAWVLLRARAAHPPTEAILALLVNALADSADHIILILDDYHAITLQPIHEAVALLLDRISPQTHVIITSRADPPLPLARLRVRGQLTEVRAADLRFTAEETTYFFDHVHGVELPSGVVTTVEERTEGWVAGLQLAALSLRHQSAAQIATFISEFSGSNAYVFDYLAHEVFQQQPDALQTFLMQTAILTPLSGPLCAEVTETSDAQALLEQLEQTNLFLIPLDSRRRWYRYHRLFQDFLRERLERAVDPAGRTLLHRRASAWFEREGLVREAIEHALSAQAWEEAVRCFAPLMENQHFYEYFLDWPRWQAALPDATLQADPDHCLRLARILILSGHIEAAERPLRLAEAVWRSADNQRKLGELLSYRALASSLIQHFSHAMRLAEQALDTLPTDAVEQRAVASYVLGSCILSLGQVGRAADLLDTLHRSLQDWNDLLVALAVAAGMARAVQQRGQLKRAATLYHDLIRRAGTATHHQQPAVYFFLGRLYYEWNDLSSAERTLHEGIAVGQRTGRGRYWPSAYAALAWVRWARGDVMETTSLMGQALAAARLLDSPSSIVEVETRQAGLWLAQGDLAAATRWMSTQALSVDDDISYERQAGYLVLARIHIAQERQGLGPTDLGAIVRLLDRLLRAAEAAERMSDCVVILGLLALAHAARGDLEQALVVLGSALTLAEPEGYIRTFVDEGSPMRALLDAMRTYLPDGESRARLSAYVDRLLAAFPQAIPAAPAASQGADLLSEREHTVLQLLAAGRSVQEIAELLIISSNTVRAHVKHIYAKLDVHNRVQALERARSLQLL